jgi:starch-binding outer membrane protein, SusD/RagB family
MKKIYPIIFTTFITLFFAACEVLDVEPAQSISADQSITNKTDLQRAVTGCYDALQQIGITRSQIIIGDLAAGNLEWTGTTQDYGQIVNNSLTANNGLNEGVWTSIYDGLNRINNVLVKIPEINDLSADEADNYTGSLKFLRGLLHFYGVRLYGGIPIKTMPSTSAEGLDVPRNTIDEVYAQIEADLTDAENLLSAGGSNGLAGKGAASALLARVYLYQEKWEDAIVKAAEVIENFDYQLDPEYGNLFSGNDSPEIIFRILFDAQDRNRIAEYFFSRTVNGGRKEVSPDSLFIAAYEAGDLRLDTTIKDASDGPYAIKYSDISGGTDNVIVIRLAEMFLIRAEANAKSGGAISVIRDDLRVVRERAGLPNVNVFQIDALILAIERERNVEFAFEGHRWFDLVRNERALELIPSVNSSDQLLFPIPQSEMLANTKMVQNPGY